MKKFVLLISTLALSACAGSAPLSQFSGGLDVPAFEETEAISVNARDIVITNNYAANKYVGDYGGHFAAVPYEVFEDYLKARFKPNGSGETLYLTIEKASLIHIRESLGGSPDDDVFSLDFTVDVSQGSAGVDNAQRVQVVQTSRQRRNLFTQEQYRQKQIAFLSRTIDAFDSKIKSVLKSF